MGLLDGFQLKRANVARMIQQSERSRKATAYQFDKAMDTLHRTINQQSRAVKSYEYSKAIYKLYNEKHAEKSNKINEQAEQVSNKATEEFEDETGLSL